MEVDAAPAAETARVQTYRPYRGTLLTPVQLETLNRLEPWRVMRDTLLLWLQIVACWTVVALWPQWWVVGLAIPVIGTRFYALFIIGHDGLHRRLFRDRRHNDLWADLFVLGAIGAITRLNRVNHMTHHDTLGLAHDPDRYKYIADDKSRLPEYLFSLTGLRYVLRALNNVFLPRAQDAARSRYSARDIAILLGWQVILIAGLTIAIGWWAYPVLWLLPVYAFTFTADIVRVFLEHSYAEPDARSDERRRLITYVSNPIELRLFAPMNMNFHAAHHLWPSIPYYNLPRADAWLRLSPDWESGLESRASYVGQLIAFAARMKRASAT